MKNKSFGLMIAVYLVGSAICISMYVTMTAALTFYCW